MSDTKLDKAYEAALRAAKNSGGNGGNKPDRLERIDHKEKLYIVREGRGYSARGFSYATKEARAAAEISGKRYDFAAIERGTVEGFREYERAMEEGREAHERTGRRSEGLLEPQLKGLEGKRVEVVDQWGEKRRFYVGKSTGWMPIHIEIARRNSSGGGGAMGPYKSVVVIGSRR